MAKLHVSRRTAFTLVELLLLVGIVALLFAMLIPAIQKVRESANQVWCKNNLRTIGQAFQSFTQGNAVYPSGGCNPGELHRSWLFHFNPSAPEIPSSKLNQNWGWAFQILPSLGLEKQWKLPEYYQEGQVHVGTTQIPVEMYFCPTRGRTKLIRRSDAIGVATIDYAGNGGHLSFVNPLNGRPYYNRSVVYPLPFTSTNLPHSGIIGANRSFNYKKQIIDPLLKPSDVNDGLANTILIAEKRINSSLATNGPISDPQPGDSLGFCSGFATDTVRTGAFPPSLDEVDPTIPVADGFGSAHPHGFNVLFADYSVRQISYRISTASVRTPHIGTLSLMQSLCHRSDSGSFSILEYE